MSKKNKKIHEITWPVGPDGTHQASDTDPQGMYTGLPEQPYELPVQDADDL